jgi:hypothetical protein
MGPLLTERLREAAEDAPAMGDVMTFSDQDLELFEKQVRPILAQRCQECHGRDSKEPGGGLILASRGAILAGGDSGASIVPGQPDNSLLIEAIRYGDQPEVRSRLEQVLDGL